MLEQIGKKLRSEINCKFQYLLWIYLLIEIVRAEDKSTCWEYCECNTASVKSTHEDVFKVKCGGFDIRLNSFSYLNKINVHIDGAMFLDLSNNDLTILETNFLHIQKLERLDLSKNLITHIQPDAFINITNIKRLDLSYNSLTIIEGFMFDHLLHLERLKLNQNSIVTVSENAFHNLDVLKQMNISGNPFSCDCELTWFADWIRSTNIKLSPPPKCHTPPSLTGTLIKKFQVDCTGNSDYDESLILELKPYNNQVVFEGDSLILRCRSLSSRSMPDVSADSRLEWSWEDGKNPSSYFSEIIINDNSVSEGYLESYLNIGHIMKDHSGNWNCMLKTNSKNHSRSVSVYVISDNTQCCKPEITANNKGVYFWPKTVAGFTVELSCEEQVTTLGQRSQFRAFHSCNDLGEWTNLDTSNCPYISETTKILEQFSKVNLTIAKKSVLESAKRLRNFTGDGRILTDSVDVVFISKTIENYLMFVQTEKELGSVLIDILASVLQLPRKILFNAQREDLACSRMVSSVESVAKHTPSLQSHKSNLAVEGFKVKKESFSGITCIWFTNSQNNKSPSRLFHCSTSNKTTLLGTSERIMEASIQVPSSLFYQLEMREKMSSAGEQQLLVTIYENNHFFPKSSLHTDNRDVTSCVVGAKLVGVEVTNLTDPVYVMLKAPILIYSNSPKPVWWDQSMNNGTGGWNQRGCTLSHFLQGLIVFYCDRLGYFGLLQDTSYLLEYSGSYIGAKFRLCHPAIYIGSFILIVCLVVTIVTYATSFDSIQMAKRAKHSLINTWISIALLCFIFSFGIYQTEEMKICQSVGLVLHYFSLSTLLWLSVAANHLYKRWSKSDPLDHVADDDLPPDEPIPKPVLGLYLVGWGIGLIVCGISGAVNLKEYAGRAFCFLSSAPALSALFVPACIFTLFLLVTYLLTVCAIRNNDTNGQLSEGTQGTENVDLELLEVPLNDRRSVQSIMTPTDSDDVEDPEHSPIVQLRAQVIVFVLYFLCWMSACVTISQTFRDVLSYEEDVFSTVYCFSCVCLGTFVLYFYCVARSDVRDEWFLLKKLLRKCCRSRNVSDTLTTPNPPVPVRNGTHPVAAALSSSSVNSSGFTVMSNGHVNRAKAARKLNKSGEHAFMHSKTTNSMNLVVLHRQMCKSNNSMPIYNEIAGPDCPEAFYNPQQSIVARKFFKKQKRNRKSDLGLRRRGDGGGGTSDGGVSQEPIRPWRPSAESAVFLSSDMENPKTNQNDVVPVAAAPPPPIDHRLVIGAEECEDERDSPATVDDCYLSRVDEVSVSEEASVTCREDDNNTVLCNDNGEELYRTVELQCSLGEHSCSDVNSDIGNNEDYPCCDNCCSRSSSCSLGPPADDKQHVTDETTPAPYDSFCRQVDELTFDNSVDGTSTPPKYVTVVDPLYGIVKVTLKEYNESAHKFSLAPDNQDKVETSV